MRTARSPMAWIATAMPPSAARRTSARRRYGVVEVVDRGESAAHRLVLRPAQGAPHLLTRGLRDDRVDEPDGVFAQDARRLPRGVALDLASLRRGRVACDARERESAAVGPAGVPVMRAQHRGMPAAHAVQLLAVGPA